MEAIVFRLYITLFAVLGQISAANLLREKPKLLVITVPERTQNEARMKWLGPSLVKLGFKYDVVHGPNMDKYCPADIQQYNQSKAAGMVLLKKEWHGRVPDMKTWDLALFQSACLTAHLRAWQHIVDTKTPMVILEDDVEIGSGKSLQSTIERAKRQGADAVLMDERHCKKDWKAKPFPREAAGLSGYWLNVKAATALLAKYPLDIPADWGVNKIFNEDMKTVCSSEFWVKEHGGNKHARAESAAHGCGRVTADQKSEEDVKDDELEDDDQEDGITDEEGEDASGLESESSDEEDVRADDEDGGSDSGAEQAEESEDLSFLQINEERGDSNVEDGSGDIGEDASEQLEDGDADEEIEG